ncbi:MAG: transglycosylase SLT domain-containing protein [Gammaproteobacteria bacterium]|nr:transglycosylase SLT domain-containing protein [Gammaproteobacteria bacterium]
MHRWTAVVQIVGLLGCSAVTSVVNSETIPAGYVQVANRYDIPPVLLYAVALTESGQSSLSDGRFRPWPWTLNINGEGHYFPSRQAAWQALQSSVDIANNSVDIGLMQISWRYHSTALGSAWQALAPYHNLTVAAAILRDCQKKNTSWNERVGCYHAPNDSARAISYALRVKVHWEQLSDPSQEVVNDIP